MRFCAAALVATVLVLPLSTARGEDAEVPTRERLARAGALVDQGLAALREGRTDAAVEILTAARKAAPEKAVTAYDLALALLAAGKPDDAREAYDSAVRAADADDPAGPAARHNLAALDLATARSAMQALDDPDALADMVRKQPGPDGRPLTPESVDMLAQQLRGKLVDEGLRAAKQSVDLLREAVRSDPSATDSARNLVLAQRARRFLETERERSKDDPQNGGEKGDDTSPSQQDDNGAGGDPGKQGDSPQNEKPTNGDEPKPPESAQPEPGKDGEQTDPSEETAPEASAEPRDLDREEAERALQRLLDLAMRRARLVEEMRARQARRGGVERDW